MPEQVNDFFLWAIEEFKQGINRWQDDAAGSYWDTQATLEVQREKEGWRGVVEPIKHALAGVVEMGLLKTLGPAFSTLQYATERVIGGLKRGKPISMGEYIPGGKYASEYAWLAGIEMHSMNDWVRETYGSDPELFAKAQAMAKEADRISYSWFNDDTGKRFKTLHAELMAAKDDDEIEETLKRNQKIIPEIVFGIALDPLNIMTWMGKTPLATRQSRKVAQLTRAPIDETLDFSTAVNRSVGRFRTYSSRARKIGDVVHDRLSSFIAGNAYSVDDLPRLVREFVADPAYDSVHGQIVKRTLDGMDEGAIFKGISTEDELGDAIDTLSKNVANKAAVLDKAAGTATWVGKSAADFTDKAQKISEVQKRILAPLFLGYLPQYFIANWWDNIRNITTRIGWRRIPGGSIADHIGASRKGAEAFFTDRVGFLPERLVRGFAVTPAEMGIGVDEAEEAASTWRKVWNWVSTGPTLKISGEVERNASALAITQSYISRWDMNWNNNLPKLPADLADELAVIGDDILDAVQSAGAGKYNIDEALRELDVIEETIVNGAEVHGRVKALGWYIQQLTKEERAAITAHPDIVAEINKLAGVTSEAERRGVLDGLRELISEGIESVAKEKHLKDLKTVGWGHQAAEIMRATEPVTGRWSTHPLVKEMLDKSGHDFDLLRRIADTYGGDPINLCDTMDDAAFDIIKHGGTPAELWQYFAENYPSLLKFFPEERAELLDIALEDGTVDLMQQLTNFDEITPASAKDAFFEIYKKLIPQARHQIVKDISEVGVVRAPPSLLADTEVVGIVKRMKDWVVAHPGSVVSPEDYDELQEAMTLAKHYMWYKVSPQNWTDWANSSFKIDRLPEAMPNLYDVYRVFKDPLESAIAKLDTRSFRDLDPEMRVPPTTWQRVMDWANTTLRKELELTQYTTIRQALLDRDYAILNYGDKTHIDMLVGIFVPFWHWPSHSIWNWTQDVIDHPYILSWLNRYMGAMEAQSAKDPLIPERLKGWMPLGAAGMYKFFTDQAWSADTEKYTRPERILLPLETMSVWGETYMPDNYQDIERGREWILVNNIWATTPLLSDGVAMLANSMLPWLDEHQPDKAAWVRRAIPPMALETGAAYWSGTRGIRGGSIILEPLLNRMGIQVPPEGLNPEGTLHEWLGMARVQPTETYWRYQWLANLAGTGEITSAEAIQGFSTQTGRGWELAVRKAAEQTVVPSAIRWGTYLPIKEFPSEERVMRGIGILYADAYKKYEAGDRDALRNFYAVYPDYRFRQLAFRYWDVASGKTTEDEWQGWIDLNLDVNEYYQKRGELERRRAADLEKYVPGTPENFRARQGYSTERAALNEEYSDSLEEYFNYLADNRRQYLQWRDGPKAKSMQKFLDRWYQAEPEQKQTMLENLPQTLLEIAISVRADEDPRLFTALEARQELARREEPIDAVYRELNNQAAVVWDMYYTDWWAGNTPATVRDEYAVYLEMDFPTNTDYREAHPELDKALDEYQNWRDGLLSTPLNPTDAIFIANIRVLHPDWDETKIEEVVKIGKQMGAFTVSEYTYIKGSDREMVINELWRFWTTLPEKSLARKRAKEFLGPRFSEAFMAGEYNQISNEELALWLNLLPSDWTTLVPEGRKPPFGEGPVPISEDMLRMMARSLTEDEIKKQYPTGYTLLPEPIEREGYEFDPTARVEKAITTEQAKDEAQAALSKARETLRAGESIDKLELPSPVEEREYQTAYAMMLRAVEGETDLWNSLLVKKWFPANSPPRRFWEFWYESVPPGKLGDWAKDNPVISAVLDKASRGYLIEDAYNDALTFLIEELPSHDIGDPREYAQARAEAKLYYALTTPELRQLVNVYSAITGKGSTAAKRAFLQQYPQIQGLFDAQNVFKAEHPVFTKYYAPGWIPREVTARGARAGAARTGVAGAGGAGARGFAGGQYKGAAVSGVTWRGFVAAAGPLVMGELLEFWAGRAGLSVAAKEHLKKVWEKSGSDMGFDDWLEYTKRLWVYFGTKDFKAPRAPQVYIPGVGSGMTRATGRARWMVRR